MTDQTVYPSHLLYHPAHDWARIAGGIATFGITSFAQDQLGEIVYWDVPPLGTRVAAGETYTELESVKAVSEVIAPLSGEIVEVNDSLRERPDVINRSPYEEGWMVRVRLSAPDEAAELLDANAYQALIA